MKATFLKLAMVIGTAAAIMPSGATAAESFSAAAIPDPCLRYEFFWQAKPAFMPESTVTIVSDGGITRALITYSTHGQDRINPSMSEQLSLSEESSHRFCAALLRLMATQQRKDERLIFDGILVNGSFKTRNGTPYKFSFQTPNSKDTPRDFGIADAVFAAFDNVSVSCELNEYLEQVAGYFPFGLRAKVMTAEPLTVRFYGAFTINDYQDIQALLAKLSKSQSIRIDVSNFPGMGTMYYPDFRRLISDVPDISWTASENSARVLAEIGVKPEKIRIIDGPSCKGERVRFARR